MDSVPKENKDQKRNGECRKASKRKDLRWTMQMHGWGRSPRLQDRCQRGQRVNPRMAPFGRAMSSCRWAALMVHRGAWCAFTATATKSKSRLFLQNNSFLVNK